MAASGRIRVSVRGGTGAPIRRFSRRRRHRPIGVLWSCIFAAGALAGCSFLENMGPYNADPAQYSVYHCKDLVEGLKTLLDRQKELRNRMDKASEGGGGTVIGTLAYRADYEKALSEENILRRTAVEKKCDLNPPSYQSDQIIH